MMRILYGVQGTGNGHISRARMLAQEFAKSRAQVTYLFSGRPANQFFDMQLFGDYLYRTGLTFASTNGCVDYWDTFNQNQKWRFIKDVQGLDLTPYDLIITDYEPVTAWAGLLQGKTVIGIGHQYAFSRDVPMQGNRSSKLFSKALMRWFAPAKFSIALHWHHFNADILPPIIDTQLRLNNNVQPLTYLVYLPFENQEAVTELLHQFPQYQFVLYHSSFSQRQLGNVIHKPTSVNGFKQDLSSVDGVICNAGFELVSECLHLGTPVLVKPLHNQVEQLANAEALQQLGYAQVMFELDAKQIQQWLLGSKDHVRKVFPDVAKTVVEWIFRGQYHDNSSIVNQLWQHRPATKASLHRNFGAKQLSST